MWPFAPLRKHEAYIGASFKSPSGRSLALERDDYFFLATDTQGLLAHLAREPRASGAQVHFDEPFEGATRDSDQLLLTASGIKCR